MKTRIEKTLPKMAAQIANGGVYKQAVRCGKPNCRCAKGEHHSASYFFTRIDGKLRKFYVPKSKLEEFSRMVNRATAARKEYRLELRNHLQLLKSFRLQLRNKQTAFSPIQMSN